MDDATQRRWAGEDVDLRQPLPSDLILAAAEADPGIRAAATGYLRMTALPSSLRAVEPRAHALYAEEWRPSPAPGPTRDELAGIVRTALHAAPVPAMVYPPGWQCEHQGHAPRPDGGGGRSRN